MQGNGACWTLALASSFGQSMQHKGVHICSSSSLCEVRERSLWPLHRIPCTLGKPQRNRSTPACNTPQLVVQSEPVAGTVYRAGELGFARPNASLDRPNGWFSAYRFGLRASEDSTATEYGACRWLRRRMRVTYSSQRNDDKPP